MKIYFAHTIKDYDSKYEDKCIFIIKEEFGNDINIINPNNFDDIKNCKNKYLSISKCNNIEVVKKHNYKTFISEMDIFYNKIEKCDILVAFPYSKTGNFSAGVKKEIQYAENIGVKVYKMFITM